MKLKLEKPLIALCLSALILLLASPGGLSAKDLSGLQSDTKYGDTLADEFLEFVGLSAQIDRTAETIVAEVVAALRQCENDVNNIDDRAIFIRSLYAPESLASSARKLIDRNLTEQEKAELLVWIK